LQLGSYYGRRMMARALRIIDIQAYETTIAKALVLADLFNYDLRSKVQAKRFNPVPNN
jgi:hypothetical protein